MAAASGARERPLQHQRIRPQREHAPSDIRDAADFLVEDQITFWRDQMRRVLAPPRGGFWALLAENAERRNGFHRIACDHFGATPDDGKPLAEPRARHRHHTEAEKPSPAGIARHRQIEANPLLPYP